jgi:acyl dehydratase
VNSSDTGAAARPALLFDEVSVGDSLPTVAIEVTYKRICMNAASTWDWFPGHHNPEYARSQGQRTIYLSTLFFHGFIDRGLNEWAGPDALIRRRKISMVRSIYPGQTATLSGKVVAKRDDGGRRLVDLELLVSSEDGPCVPSEATVELADPFVEVQG